MKVIIIGSPAVGKTTLVEYLRKHTSFPLIESDEEMVRLNNGVWPKDDDYRNKTLLPQIIKDVKSRNNVVFVAPYIPPYTLIGLRWKGFKIINLEADLETLRKRNIERMEKRGWEDAAQWFEGHARYDKRVKRFKLANKVIDANQSTEKIAEEILSFINAEG